MADKITGVQHAVLPTRDIETGLKFYEETLGLERVAHIPGAKMGFLSFGSKHHELALSLVDENEPTGSPGKSHTGIHIEGGPEALEELYEQVAAKGVKTEKVHDFGFMHGFYLYDPDGNRIELFCDVMEDQDALDLLRSRDKPVAAS